MEGLKGTEKLPTGWKHAKIAPQYWHEWGNEKRGEVSTFAYDQLGDYHFTGYRPKEEVKHLPFLNPYS